ncbi:MAG: hypothetical protein IKK58_04890 [Clostridia bacterium]|nr:hypothetical protein [Clostridia bacterium]
MKKFNTLEKVLALLGVLLTVLPLVLAANYYKLQPSFPIIDVVIIACYLLASVLLVYCLCRLILSMNGNFRSQILLPAAVVALLGALSLTMIGDIDIKTVKNDFARDRAIYDQAVTYLNEQEASQKIKLPEQYAALSLDGEVISYSCNDGKHTCYLFVMLETDKRLEGILYVAGNSPSIYYDIVSQYSSYSYEDLLSNYVFIAFTK